MAEPQSRSEAILQAKINGEEYNGLPQSRVEYLLLQLDTGGGGGTTDYNQLINRPHTPSGKVLEGDITDEVDEVTPGLTSDQIAELKKLLTT